jgi:hypothetical protein
VSVLVPAFEKVIEQLPTPDESVPVQDSPVLALTLTEPVGPVPTPATEKLMTTAWLRFDGFGVFDTIAVVLVALVAVVLCVLGEGDE